MKEFKISKNKLYLNDGRCIFVTKQMIADFNLTKKESLEIEEFNELMERRIKITAYDILSKRDYSIKEFKEKLVFKYREPKIVEKITADFIDNGYLDDYQYAISYARSHKYGKKKLEYIFLKNSISRDIISQVLDKLNTSQIEDIKALLNKNSLDIDKKIQSLLRKGYEYADIKKAVRDLEEEKK